MRSKMSLTNELRMCIYLLDMPVSVRVNLFVDLVDAARAV